MKKYVAICIMAIGLYALQPPSWEVCGEIDPGVTNVYDLVETPNGVLIAATNFVYIGGAYYFFWRSTDGGNTWSLCDISYPFYGAYHLDLESTPSGRVYAMYALQRTDGLVHFIFYSDDDGQTWSELPQPRIPLRIIFKQKVNIKYHNGKLYVWGLKSSIHGGSPIFHTELWYYDEASSQWNKWDILPTEHGFTIEKGPGPQAGQTYLYLGTSSSTGSAKVIRINQPIGNLQNKNLSKEEK